MTRNDDFIERLEGYLDEYEGMTPLPDGVRDAIRAELPRTKQAGAVSGLARFLIMTRSLPALARYGLAAAAVVVVVLLGASFIGRAPVGAPPSPTPSPSASVAATATATDPGPWSLLDAPRSGNMPAGDYYLDISAYPARIDFSVPDGWWYYWSGSLPQSSDVHAILVDSQDIAGPNESAWGIAFGVVNTVRVDPCKKSAGYMDRSVTESAETLVTALETWTDFSPTVEDVTVGGLAGKRVEFTATCEGELFTTPAAFVFGTSPAENPQFTFLDVGGSVFVIWTTDFPQTTQLEVDNGASPDPEAHVADQLQLRDIVDSLVITPH